MGTIMLFSSDSREDIEKLRTYKNNNSEMRFVFREPYTIGESIRLSRGLKILLMHNKNYRNRIPLDLNEVMSLPALPEETKQEFLSYYKVASEKLGIKKENIKIQLMRG